ncbi:MAG: hypothetical protein RRB13_11460 [bacterium]|nr:hypothetical protein [bacterium]
MESSANSAILGLYLRCCRTAPGPLIEARIRKEASKFTKEGAVGEIDRKCKEFEELLKSFHGRMVEANQAQTRLHERIHQDARQLNFVRLSGGFLGLRGIKGGELKYRFLLMFALGIAMFAVPAVAWYLNYRFIDQFFTALLATGMIPDANPLFWERIAAGVPFVVVEVLLVFVFRVLLGQYQSIQTQILQLDVRVSLLQFIEDYMKLKKEGGETEREALGKLENLLFAPIISEGKGLPNTYDGLPELVKQISGLIKAGRGA